MKFKIKCSPPSVDSVYQIIWSLKEVQLKPEAKLFKNNIKLYTPLPDISDDKPLKIAIEVYGKWYTKDGKIRTRDIQNSEKVLIDAIFEKIGINDSHIFYKTTKKIQSEEDYIVVEIENYNE